MKPLSIFYDTCNKNILIVYINQKIYIYVIADHVENINRYNFKYMFKIYYDLYVKYHNISDATNFYFLYYNYSFSLKRHIDQIHRKLDIDSIVSILLENSRSLFYDGIIFNKKIIYKSFHDEYFFAHKYVTDVIKMNNENFSIIKYHFIDIINNIRAECYKYYNKIYPLNYYYQVKIVINKYFNVQFYYKLNNFNFFV